MFYVQIGSDPTIWWITQGRAIDSVAQELAQAASAALPVEFPLAGTLVVSARSAGTVWVGPPPPMGSHPSGAVLPGAGIHLPSAVEATPKAPGGYRLLPGTDLDQLQQNIVAAMNGGTMLTVPVADMGLGATIVLSGASLAYAVICPQS